jgi:hypothetical protein
MAKKDLLGSGGSKSRLQRSGQHLGKTGLPGGGAQPWVDPAKSEAAQRAGQAGGMLHKELSKSKGTGLKPPR